MASKGELTSYFESNQLMKMMEQVINPAQSVTIGQLRNWIKPTIGFKADLDDYKVLAQICHVKRPSEKALMKNYVAKNTVQKVQSKTIRLDRDGRVIIMRYVCYF